MSDRKIIDRAEWERLSAAARLAMALPEPTQHSWGYSCPRCGRIWIGRQGFRLSAARRHVAACVPLREEQQDALSAWVAARDSFTKWEGSEPVFDDEWSN